MLNYFTSQCFEYAQERFHNCLRDLNRQAGKECKCEDGKRALCALLLTNNPMLSHILAFMQGMRPVIFSIKEPV